MQCLVHAVQQRLCPRENRRLAPQRSSAAGDFLRDAGGFLFIRVEDSDLDLLRRRVLSLRLSGDQRLLRGCALDVIDNEAIGGVDNGCRATVVGRQLNHLRGKTLHLLKLRTGLQQQQVDSCVFKLSDARAHLLWRAHQAGTESAIRDRVIL